MSSSIGRKVQTAIDHLRGKKRQIDPADARAVSRRDAQRLIRPTGTLEEIFYSHNGRIAQKWHHHFEICERHLEPLRQRPESLCVLELGVSRGGSLEIWRKYFGPKARIIGIDIDPARSERVDPENTAIIGDQSDPAVLASAIERLAGGVDLVIDDGSHLGRHQIPTFAYLYPRISEWSAH